MPTQLFTIEEKLKILRQKAPRIFECVQEYNNALAALKFRLRAKDSQELREILGKGVDGEIMIEFAKIVYKTADELTSLSDLIDELIKETVDNAELNNQLTTFRAMVSEQVTRTNILGIREQLLRQPEFNKLLEEELARQGTKDNILPFPIR